VSGAGDVRFRPMRDADAERVAALAGELGYPSTPSEILRRKAVLDRETRHGLFVAETTAGEVAGWIIVSEMCSLELDPHAEVKGLVVAEAARGRGIGRELMRVAEGWASARGLREVVLRSNVVRDRTHAFYRGIGYEEQKRQVKFRKRLA
jgi:ribosomal protein S18 acetylase RimI-like enzyme